ncbi:MAG: hypothetical protein ACYTFK_14555, partial [Planctomycetota bacterium]
MTQDTALSIPSLNEEEEALETGAVSEAVKRYEKKLKEAQHGGDVMLFNPELKLLMEYAPLLEKAIVKDLIGKGPVKAFKRDAYGAIKPVELAVLTIRHCFNNYIGDQTMQTICIKLADDVRVHKDDKRFARDFAGYRAVVSRSIKSSHMGHRHKVMTHARHKMGVEDTDWGKKDKLVIGKTLIDLFIDSCGLFFVADFEKPNKVYVKRLRRSVRQTGKTLKATDWTLGWLKENHDRCSVLTPVLKPMVIPPRPWTDPFSGGYISRKFAKGYRSCRLIRGVDRKWLKTAQIAPEVYEAVNAIQTTGYRINNRVLKILEHLKFSGLAGLPDGEAPKKRIVSKPWGEIDKKAFLAYKALHPEVVSKWTANAHRIHQEYFNEQSKRTALLEKIRMAKLFVGK